jgi:hypothetical protein
VIVTPAACVRRRANREITVLRSAGLSPLSSNESNAMQSWRGGLSPTIGFSAFLMAILLDDVCVVWEASPESVFHQQPIEIPKRFRRHVGRPNLHRRTSRRVKHPCRHDNRSARFPFNDENVSPGAPLTVKVTHAPSVERMPSVVDL